MIRRRPGNVGRPLLRNRCLSSTVRTQSVRHWCDALTQRKRRGPHRYANLITNEARARYAVFLIASIHEVVEKTLAPQRFLAKTKSRWRKTPVRVVVSATRTQIASGGFHHYCPSGGFRHYYLYLGDDTGDRRECALTPLATSTISAISFMVRDDEGDSRHRRAERPRR
jgi:hypothetical protein